MKNWYGCIGFLSLLGFWGILGEEPLFLCFFAFALFFEYFWVNPDEMFIENIPYDRFDIKCDMVMTELRNVSA